MKEWLGWMSTKFPLEIPAAFGLPVICPESFAGVFALRGESNALCRDAERRGYCDDLCSYTRIGISAAADLPAGLRKPDFLLCCDNICSNMVQWYQEMARLLNVPIFLLDIPFQAESEVSDRTIAYLRAQMGEIISGLENLTGKKWDDSAFREVCRTANASADAWQAVMDTALSDRPPLKNMELFDYMPLMVTKRCDPETPVRLKQAAEELKNRPSPWRNRPDRIFFEGTPCWPHQTRMIKMLDERNLFIAADTLTPSLLFRYRDTDEMLRAYCQTINGSCLESGIRMRADLCRRYKVEGILVHYNRSCRPWCGTLPVVERRLRDTTGLPLVSFGGDQADPRVFSSAQFETRLDGLKEIMEAKRYGG